MSLIQPKPVPWPIAQGLITNPNLLDKMGFLIPFWGNQKRIYDLIQGGAATIGGATPSLLSTVNTSHGMGVHRASGSGGAAYYTVNSGITQNQYTLMSVAEVFPDANYKAMIDDDNNPTSRVFQFRATTAELPEFIVWNTSVSLFSIVGTTNLSNAVHVIMAKVDGNDASIWVDGKNEGSVTISGTPATPNSTFRLFDRKVSVYIPFYGRQLLTGAWDRALSDEEMQEVGLDPFQLIRMADDYPAWVVAAAGGASIPVLMNNMRGGMNHMRGGFIN